MVCDGKLAFDAWMLRRGHHGVERATSSWRAVAELPVRWLWDAAAPRLNVDIAFAHVQTLRAAQQAALRRGHIDATSKQDVPAHVVIDGARSKVKLRLKGDNLDHVNTTKLSLRVEVDGEPPVLGLRAFSLQAPPTKGFHLEALFHASVRHLGLLSPRYEFVRASYNGDDVGVMALEEHCAKELLERQGRRDSVVVRFEEEQMFEVQARLRTTDPALIAVDDYRTAPVRVVGTDHAYPQQDEALALLRAFVAGSLRPSQVFDVEALATYLAVCELWGAWHPLRWHNLRFHFDPLRGRLAPIGFDGNLHMRVLLGRLVTPLEPLVERMLQDGEVFAAFRRRLRALCAPATIDDLVRQLARVQVDVLPVVQSEYWLLQGFPLDELRERAAYLGQLGDDPFRCRPVDSDLEPLLVSEIGPGHYELVNVASVDAIVHGLRFVRPDGGVLPVELPASWPRPFRVPGKPPWAANPRVALELAVPAAAKGLPLEVESHLDRSDQRHFVRAVKQPPCATSMPLPALSVQEVLARHPWLHLEEDGSTLSASAGRHEVRETLVLPAGVRLVIGAGTELLFAADAALVVQGAVEFAGQAAMPVVLRGASDKGWLGVAVLAPDADCASRWQHVRVCDTLGVHAGTLTFTGGVVFDRGRVALHDVLLSGTGAEDALNIIRAEVDLLRVHIERTTSDAFDGDFVHGTVRDCEFRDIGGDAIDVSGADVTVQGCRMHAVRDKALSVGERSKMTASEISVDDVGAGAASKDGSLLELRDSTIVGARVAGVMAYMKKPEFGGSRAKVLRVTCTGDAPAVRVQHGSALERDGRAVVSEAIDVEALYNSVMRKR